MGLYALYCQLHEVSVSFDIVLQCVLLVFTFFPRNTLNNFEFDVFCFEFAILNIKTDREKPGEFRTFKICSVFLNLPEITVISNLSYQRKIGLKLTAMLNHQKWCHYN